MFVVMTFVAFIAFTLRTKSNLRIFPVLNGNKCLVDTVAQEIILIPNDPRFVSGAVNLFGFATTISNFATVGGILDDFADLGRAEQLAPGVPVVQLQDAVALQILCDEPPAHLFMHIQVED